MLTALTTLASAATPYVKSLSSSPRPNYAMCPNEMEGATVQATWNAMTASERAEFTRLWNVVNSSLPLTQLMSGGRWQEIAHALAGGDDCAFKEYSEHAKYFSRMVTKYSGGTMLAPTIPDVQMSAQQRAVDAAKEIGTNILQTTAEIGSATVRSGIEGGVAASEGARVGAQVGGFGMSGWALVAGAAALAYIVARK